MKPRLGTFIALEGTDGSGKATQFRLLIERLEELGYEVLPFDFPRYDEPSSYFIREYLNGKYGSSQQVGPYTSSLFYALDRYQAAPRIREALAAGKIVLANRFAGSNMAHQGAKFSNAEERRGYFIWVDNLEFQILGIPRPDISIVLRVPAEMAQKLVDQKAARNYTNKKRDLHEADIAHLKKSVEVYDDLCQLFPKDFTRIDCVRSEKLMNITAVQDLVWKKVEPLLPPAADSPAAKKAADQITSILTRKYNYLTPEGLNSKLQREYQTGIEKLLGLQRELATRLAAYAKQQGNTPIKELQSIARLVLPLAVTSASAFTPAPTESLAPTKIPLSFMQGLPAQSGDHAKLTLTSYWPKNELDLVADALFEHSTLSLAELSQGLAAMPYQQKVSILEYAAQNNPTVLEKAHYSWDILSDYATFKQYRSLVEGNEALAWQPLTPRYGYDVPHLIEAAGLSELFEECFDLSVELYSAMQEADYPLQAQYTTLLGHKLRWTITHNARELFHLKEQVSSNPNLLLKMQEKLAESHPVIGRLNFL